MLALLPLQGALAENQSDVCGSSLHSPDRRADANKISKRVRENSLATHYNIFSVGCKVTHRFRTRCVVKVVVERVEMDEASRPASWSVGDNIRCRPSSRQSQWTWTGLTYHIQCHE